MFCRSCGSPLSDGAKFCPKCGMQTSKATQSATQKAAQPSVCPQCGAPLSATAKFCPKCGSDVLENARSATQQPVQQAQSRQQSAAERFRQSYQQGKQKGQELLGGESADRARQTQYDAAQETAGAAGRKAAKTAAKSAAKSGARAALSTVAKAAVVGTIGIAVVGGATTVLNNGGGGNTPPADPPGYEQNYSNPGGGENTYTNDPGGESVNTGGYTGGGYTSAQEGQNFTRFWMQVTGFPTEDGQPRRKRGEFYIIERDAATGKAHFWLNKREGEPNSSWDYDPNTGTITIPDDDPNLTLRLTLNPDGSLSGGVTEVVEVENGSVRGCVYVKLTGLTSEDGENWTVPSTGETFKQDEFYSTTAMGESDAMYEFEQEAIAWARANGVTLQYSEPEEEKPTYNPTPQPSMGKIDPPEDVLRYYVQVEAQNRLREQAGYSTGHVTLPENWNITQQQFDAMVEQEMRGQIMNP